MYKIFVSELKSWLQRSGRTWTSHTIIDEIVKRMADTILRQKCDMIRQARYFAIIVDETSDVSRAEQVSISIRIMTSDFETHEIFLGFYHTPDTKSETLYNVVRDVLCRLNLTFFFLREQCYDGARNMSGRISGLKTRVI